MKVVATDSRVWDRVEELAEALEKLDTADAARRIEELRNGGEPPSVLSLVGSWLALAPLPVPLGIGDVVTGRYHLRGKLGEGGMGCVWRAAQEMIERDVAVKVIHPVLVSPALQRRFTREMEILGKLDHVGIVHIFEAGFHVHEGKELPFFSMELVDGVPLSKWAESHREKHGKLLGMTLKICEALQHAHDRNVVHRDLKPSNIMVRTDGQPKVLDFGIARLAGVELDEAGLFSGTPQYAAPEQHLGRDRDFRSGESVDVFAVGAILFEIISGRRLFAFPRGTSISEMRRAILEDAVPRLAEVLPGCPAVIDEIVARAVRRDPADRFYSMSAMLRALSRAVELVDGSAQQPPAWVPMVGVQIPGTLWKLTERIGEGGAGQVWAGVHNELEQRRIFKFCDTEEKTRTLKREMTLFRLLKERVGKNPHFIQLHEVALDEPPWYLMMDFVDAKDLAAYDVPMTVEQRLDIVAQAAEALQVAHEVGILHRDIKPANLLIGRTGKGEPHVYIADFGIGQIIADELLREGTHMGFTRTVSGISGTLMYMAPEVIEGGAASARSDIYSLGVVLWQLLIGSFGTALDPTNWGARISDPLLRSDLEKCLAGAPEQRWSSIGALAASLRSLPERHTAEAKRKAELAATAHRAYRRGVWRTTAVAAVLLVLVSTLASLAWIQRRNAERARADGAVEQASNILILGNSAGRRSKGLALLEGAVTLSESSVAIRSLAAGFLALPDLETLPQNPASHFEPPSEKSRIATPDGVQIAVGRAISSRQGAIDIYGPTEDKMRTTFSRSSFPWVPIPEPGMLQFSPSGRLLAIAGPSTSSHILIADARTATLESYIYEPTIRCFGWHRSGRIVASGGAERSVNLWDLASARVPPISDGGDLPPFLHDRAVDNSLAQLVGWRGSLCSLVFHPNGEWLAGLDDSGWLRMFGGFVATGLPNLPDPQSARDELSSPSLLRPILLVETKLDRTGMDGHLDVSGGNLIVSYPRYPPLALKLSNSRMFVQKWLSPNVQHLAWSNDGRTLCVTTNTDAYWLNGETLEPLSEVKGCNPDSVAYESSSDGWVLPRGKEFILRRPRIGGISTTDLSKDQRWLFSTRDHEQVSKSTVVSAGVRVAIYCGRHLQFALNGKPDSDSESISIAIDGGNFRDLLWDRAGKLATVVFAKNKAIIAESYNTEGRTNLVGRVSSNAQRIVSAEDGQHLIERSVESGIGRRNAKTGEWVNLDASQAAKQDAPLAVSPDGFWIAAVTNRNVIRITRKDKGTLYAEIPTPHSAAIDEICWSVAGDKLATVTEDGHVQLWIFKPWKEWMQRHGVAEEFSSSAR